MFSCYYGLNHILVSNKTLQKEAMLTVEKLLYYLQI